MVDVYLGFEALGNPNSLYVGDKLHLRRDGYSKWEAWVTSALADDDCAMWKSGMCDSDGDGDGGVCSKWTSKTECKQQKEKKSKSASGKKISTRKI